MGVTRGRVRRGDAAGPSGCQGWAVSHEAARRRAGRCGLQKGWLPLRTRWISSASVREPRPREASVLTGPAGTCGCQGQCNQRRLLPSPGLPVSLSPTVSGSGHFQNFLFSFPGGGGARCEGLRGSERLEEGPVRNSLVLGEKETACRGPRVPQEPCSSSLMGTMGPQAGEHHPSPPS